MVQYKTSEAQADTNEALVRAVFGELRARAPEGLRYASYRLPDGVTFVHVASVETPADDPLLALPAFKAFLAGIKERCVVAPVATEVSLIDSYGFRS